MATTNKYKEPEARSTEVNLLELFLFLSSVKSQPLFEELLVTFGHFHFSTAFATV
jgi:hypothetical protein